MFKVGDTVKCVSDYGILTVGDIYTVSVVYSAINFITVKEINKGRNRFRQTRFVLAKPVFKGNKQ